MTIYTNEHLTDLLNEQYEKVRELEKKLKDAIEVIKFYSVGYVIDQKDWEDDDDADCINTWNLYTGKRARAFLATLNEVRE